MCQNKGALGAEDQVTQDKPDTATAPRPRRSRREINNRGGHGMKFFDLKNTDTSHITITVRRNRKSLVLAVIPYLEASAGLVDESESCADQWRRWRNSASLLAR